jgi:phosphoribosyl 1,2-cyclic phosphate phosphodiesterase
MSLKFTILGCGASQGSPRVGLGWGASDPNEPKNRRLRCSLLVERITSQGKTQVLIDTGPDVREQLIKQNITHLDGVVYTHEHADHTHGIDDLRPLALLHRKKVNIYADEATAAMFMVRFRYCFESVGSAYPAILQLHNQTAYEAYTINGAGGEIPILPLPVNHGQIDALGFRFGNTAYIPDVKVIYEKTAEHLEGLDTLVIDALRYAPHVSHFCLDEALEWINRLKPKRAILTNMLTDLDYNALKAKLPAHIEPAFDGMIF